MQRLGEGKRFMEWIMAKNCRYYKSEMRAHNCLDWEQDAKCISLIQSLTFWARFRSFVVQFLICNWDGNFAELCLEVSHTDVWTRIEFLCSISNLKKNMFGQILTAKSNYFVKVLFLVYKSLPIQVYRNKDLYSWK